jgi:glutamyl-tRNA reductase
MPADPPFGFVSVGLSHQTAPVEIRERLALDEDAVKRHLVRLKAEHIVDEALLVSTCNRVELYAVADAGGAGRVTGWLNQFHGPGGEPVDKFLTWRAGRDAIVHLFRVASSLDSLVVGEPQILGQMKDAVRAAEESGALGRVLSRLSHRALHVAKRVRSETAIGRFRVGVGNAGVDLAKQIFGDLNGRKALLIGVGEMGRQVAKALVDAGLSELYVANRTFDKATELANEVRGIAIPYDRIDETLAKVDVILTATGATTPILGVDAVKKAMRARRWDPLFLVDLAVPRNIDPAVGKLDEAYLFNVDDLAKVLDRGREARDAAGIEAERIIEEEADRFVTSLREIEAGPALGRIVTRAEALRKAELARSKRLLDALDPEQTAALDAMTKALVKKLLDGTLQGIREAAREGDQDRLDTLLDPWEEKE